jgi:TRAP-type transport system small permease protein
LSIVNKVGHMIEKLIGKVVLLFMSALVILVFTEVLLRYVFSSGMVWAEELERYLFVWLMFLGIAVGIYKQKHIAITTLTEKLSKYFRGFGLLVHIITGSFFLVLTWQGTKYMIGSSSGTASVLPIGLGYIYSIIPVASFIALIFIIVLIVGGKEDK